MHNFKLLTAVGIAHDLPGEGAIKLCSITGTRDLYVANPLGIYCLKHNGGQRLMEEVLVWKEHNISTEEVVACDVVNTNVCVTTAEGDVLFYAPEESEVETVGSVSEGIVASCWSPDQELMVIVTGDDQVSLLSADCVPIAHFSLQEEGFGEAAPIALGWGKKETQFHGTEGKRAAKAVSIVESGLAPDDDGKARISWRGDGKMFAVNYIDKQTETRKLKITNREGVLQSTSEVVSKLEQSLSWKPSGSTIASTQKLPNKYQVIFYEKNGLRHGEFTLPDKPNSFVKEVIWNLDSTVLLVWFQTKKNSPVSDPDCTKDDSPSSDHLQLWTVSNYSWSLKEELAINDVRAVLWDEECPLNLYVANSKCILSYSWTFCINKSTGHTDSDLTLVSVVNGNRLLMTPFRKRTIPPPMCAYEIQFPDQIRGVVYSPDNTINDSINSNSLCVLHGSCLTLLSSVDSYDDLDQYNCHVDYKLGRSPNFKITFPVHKVIAQYDLKEINKLLFSESRHLSLAWLDSTTLYCINSHSEADHQVVLAIDISETCAKVLPVSAPSGPFLNLCCHQSRLYLQDYNGQVFMMEKNDSLMQQAVDADGVPIVFQSACNKMEVASAGGDTFIFGLSSRNRLYYGNKQLVGNCSSFHVHDDHLLLTVTSHKLLTIPLGHQALNSFTSDNLVGGERNIERGSKLITAVSCDSTVILQMPRGNLESIYPRSLMIHILKTLLNTRQYHQAVELMRKHRVDMNLIHDHNPADFFTRCDEFVRSVNNAGWIDLFIASLNNDDTTATLFAYDYQGIKVDKVENDDGLSKVDGICRAVRESMIKIDEDKYLLPILSSYVKMDSSEMDEALKKVKSLKDSKMKDLPINAEVGLAHLLYFADANILCDVALGTYDFDLVMMVFEKSQKDPKEFLPFLNQLKKMESRYMKYSINVHLKRYQRAFMSIKDTGDSHIDECLKLVKKEKIFSIALDVFVVESPLYKAVAEAYGDYNLGRGYYGEAALLYERAEKLSDALDAYTQHGNWRKAMVVAFKLKYPREQMLEFYENTVEVLKEKEMYEDAAILYNDYLSNPEEAVVCLTKAQRWDDALRIVHQLNRMDLLLTNVLPSVREQAASYEQELCNMSNTFSSHCARLVIVRSNLEKHQKDLSEGIFDDNMDPDTYCDASTVTGASHSRGSKSGTGSNVSGRTYRSAKNRKKLERKKLSTKEGSSFEDLGIITELHSLISRADKMAGPVGGVVSTLFNFMEDIVAYDLQERMHKLLRLMETKEKIIWPHEDTETNNDHLSMTGSAQMTSVELLRLRQQGLTTAANGSSSLVFSRMKQLEPALRHAPKPVRPSDWALGFLHKK